MTDEIFNLDLDSVEPLVDRSPIKAGPQRIRVTGVETGKSAVKGTPYVEITAEYTNVDGLEPVTEGTKPSTIVSRKYYLSQNALPFLRNLVEGLGISWDAYKQNRDFQQFVGLEGDFRIDLNTNNETGSKWNEIGKAIISNPVS